MLALLLTPSTVPEASEAGAHPVPNPLTRGQRPSHLLEISPSGPVDTSLGVRREKTRLVTFRSQGSSRRRSFAWPQCGPKMSSSEKYPISHVRVHNFSVTLDVSAGPA